ncbi:MAG TPA: PhzF family phenazine biosynthesis protein [Cytophagales bacterium]|nr:PhzF family phenazine biosynthesis protein [Cytophagales bacterium]HAA21040.1 PhzF family phenazine biosynthesis protein [Cytophagales bacterium]HAP61521.1 PhzF family phenazine biosynthesis protein [Cytophagales bacterium]
MKIFQVDAFTERPFNGNPAAVCMVEGGIDDATCQAIATEMNLSETAFVEELEGEFNYSLRWFTPAAEVDLCGHATLASGHVLFSEGINMENNTVRFQTRSGELLVHQDKDMLVMDFPARLSANMPLLEEFEEMFAGSEIVAAARDKYNLILEMPTEAVVRKATPNMEAIAEHSDQGVIITAPGDRYDFVSRFFGPNVGVPEDPVTGSAHCQLGPYWAKKLGKNSFRAYQASARGGEIGVEVKEDRCLLKGYAVTVFRGELAI